MLSRKAAQFLREQIVSMLEAGRAGWLAEENMLSEVRRTTGLPISKAQLRRQIRSLMEAGTRIDTTQRVCEDPRYQLSS